MTEENKTTESQNQATVDQTLENTVFDDGVEESGPDQQETTVPDGQEQQTGQEEETGQEKEPKPINQEAVNKKINKHVFEKHEERRKREEAEQKLAEATRKIEQMQKPKEDETAVPEMPDPYDFDFQAKIKQRDEIIRKNAEIRARKELEKQNLLRQQEEQQRQVQETTKKQVETMYQKAAEIGISNEEFAKADRRVAMFIQDPGVAMFLLKNENSPLIVQYLSQNVTELESISKMDAISAAIHINNVVTPNALKLKPSNTQTPNPLDIPQGKAGGEKKSRFLDGVVIE